MGNLVVTHMLGSRGELAATDIAIQRKRDAESDWIGGSTNETLVAAAGQLSCAFARYVGCWAVICACLISHRIPVELIVLASVLHQSHQASLVRYDGVLCKDKYPVSDLISQLLSGR